MRYTNSLVYFTSSILEGVVGKVPALTVNSTNTLNKKRASTAGLVNAGSVLPYNKQGMGGLKALF